MLADVLARYGCSIESMRGGQALITVPADNPAEYAAQLAREYGISAAEPVRRINTMRTTYAPRAQLRQASFTPLDPFYSTTFQSLPVVGEDKKLLGFIAEKDVLHHLFPTLEDAMNLRLHVDFEGMEANYRNVLSLKVADLMTTKAITVSPDMPILQATSIMVKNRFRRIPVADGDKLVGMLSLGDVHKALFKQAVTNA